MNGEIVDPTSVFDPDRSIEYINKYVKSKNITQKSMEKETGMRQSNISAMLGGNPERRLTIDKIDGFARAIGRDWFEVFLGTDLDTSVIDRFHHDLDVMSSLTIGFMVPHPYKLEIRHDSVVSRPSEDEVMESIISAAVSVYIRYHSGYKLW